MAKRVAVIDIGSNSIRMVVYEKTSRFAFHILYEAKSKVRLSQDAYKHQNNLQVLPMQRTFDALSDFLEVISSYNVKKTFCVATSALRDAPNKKIFIKKVQNELKLHIKVIDGEKEAYLGAVACANLLPKQENALSIDIGGGSTEFAYISGENIQKSFSLELGTVRLKELFFDSDLINEAIQYIDDKLSVLDENLTPTTLIGIGGTFRAITNSLIKLDSYPLNKVHAYESNISRFENQLYQIMEANEDTLESLHIKKSRFDIIKPGTLILQRVLKKLSSLEKTVTSGSGVREGVFLIDLLRNSKHKLPHNYNTSLRYLLDSYIYNTTHSNNLSKTSKKLFDLTYKHMNIPENFKNELSIASKLYPIGSSIHFFSKNRHSYYLIKSALEYGFTHAQIMLIATLVRYGKNKLPSQKHLEKYKELLPNNYEINYLSFIISLSIALLSHKPKNIDFNLDFNDGYIDIKFEGSSHLSKEAISKLDEIQDLKVLY